MTVKGIRSGRQRALVDAALAAGWTARVDGDSHIRLVPPRGRGVTISTTANDQGRQYLNARAALRREGLDV